MYNCHSEQCHAEPVEALVQNPPSFSQIYIYNDKFSYVQKNKTYYGTDSRINKNKQ